MGCSYTAGVLFDSPEMPFIVDCQGASQGDPGIFLDFLCLSGFQRPLPNTIPGYKPACLYLSELLYKSVY